MVRHFKIKGQQKSYVQGSDRMGYFSLSTQPSIPKSAKKRDTKEFFCDWGIISKTSTQQTPEILGHATIFFSPNARDPRDPVTDGSRLES